MSTLSDLAFDGTLTPDALKEYIAKDATVIDKPAGKKDLTPLCAAVTGGHLGVVQMLLEKHARPDVHSNYCTPLYLATRRKLKDQVAIIRALLTSKANPNLCYDDTGRNTPVMNAIVQLRDADAVRELVDGGADVKLKNAKGKSAEELAAQYGLKSALRPRSQRAADWGYTINVILAVVRFVLALVNVGAIMGSVKGTLGKLYGITGTANRSDLDKEVATKAAADIDSHGASGTSVAEDWAKALPAPVPGTSPGGTGQANQITLDQLQKGLDDYLEDRGLDKFFKPGDPFVSDLARRAAALRVDPNSIYNNPDNVKRLTTLSLYQPVIYCDDSGSMEVANRYGHQSELVTRISRIATKILPDGYGVDLRFINNGCTSRLSAEDIYSTVQNVRPRGGTKIGTNLRTKILEPLVYSVLNSGKTLERPILVCTITDGCPTQEHEEEFKRNIVECKRKLDNKDYESTAVMFMVSQIGDDPQATQFLQKLRDDQDIKDVLYCTSDRLDDQFKELKNSENRLEEWLLKTLTRPIMDRE